MNMQNLMAQAQRMQKELKKINEEIERSEFEGESGAVKTIITGKSKVIKIEIKDETILSEKELVEDMVMISVNNALEKLAKEKEQKLSKYTGGMGGLF